VLYDEEIVVQTRWVARERVRLATRAVIEDREISEDLRREQIEIDATTQRG
jgi:stress response protein YsnF